mmetsp:Transcript_11774/g.20985  ORF Transcript_11774/g.20985 Transcript_11774/m.20985 type:complete len:170 (+) Transcript_11774:351-860(+)
MPHVIATSKFMVDAAKVLKVPCIVTEQYPKGLLKTVDEIDIAGFPVFEKTKFSMLTPEVQEHLSNNVPQNKEHAVVFGIEAHVCVYQTCLDLLDGGWKSVQVVVDGVSSSKILDRNVALESLQQRGVLLRSAESILFELTNDAKATNFKQISALVKAQNDVLGKLESSL